PGLIRLTHTLPAFARAGTPAVRALGSAAQIGRREVRAVQPVASYLNTLAARAGPVVGQLDRLLVSGRDAGFFEGLPRFLYGVAAIVYVSYTANSGLPFAGAYRLTVEVPNADRLIKNDEVRIGGVRVGQVQGVTAQTAPAGRRPFARIEVSLSPSAGPLPVDT